MHRGYVKSWRKQEDWGWYKKPNTAHLFNHLVKKANHKESIFEGHPVPKGSCVTGRKKLSEQTGLSIQEVRTALTHLESTKDVTIKTTNKYSIISITNYDHYQVTNQEVNHQATIKQPHLKNVKNVKNKNTCPKPNNFDFEAVYQEYPKKEGKQRGLVKCKATIKTQKQYDQLMTAVRNYAIKKANVDPQYRKQFSTFMGCWKDYVIIEADAPTITANEQAQAKLMQSIEQLPKEEK